MEFLVQIGSFFNSILAGVERLVTRLFGSSNEKRVRQIGFQRDKKTGTTTIVPGSILDRINQLEPQLEQLTDDELKQTATKFRARLAAGETLEQLLPEAFAHVRESGKRYLKMRHYDVQMVGGCILHQGMIAEMVTGEGKTLVSSLPAFLNGLAGSVHVVTVNDYLARRDMEWMGPLHIGLGLTVGAIQSNMSAAERQQAYGCDITYGTNNELGFDYLRDNMKPRRELQVQRGGLNYAIVDEIDNILIDEARTPLIISGPAEDDVTKYPRAHRIALQLKRDVHFEIKEKEHTCHLTDEGVRAAEELAGVESFYTAGNMEWPHLIDNALRAIYLYKRDVQYVVEKGEVVIVDEHTGRKMEGRQWSDGLHQAVEAKEGVRIKEESQTLATITLQNFFKMYKKLSGMTGTAMTEANEFWKIYHLDVVSVPTNRPTKRLNPPDAIYRTVPEKWTAVIEEVKEVSQTGRPVLVGTVSIESSELLSDKLKRVGIKHNVLNAKNHEREAEIIAQAGRQGAVTIATNMAGRGTDIILGGNPEYLAWDELKQTYANRLLVPKSVWDECTKRIAVAEGMVAEGRKVAELGGLHVVGTERHDSRRIDLQLRGRAGRQGDPGSSRFFLSLEDDLMRKFAGDWMKDWMARLGMEEGERIESRMVSSQIEGAQKKVEERHFEMRKHLLEYDEVMDEQRKRVYNYRQAILDGANCRELILTMIDRQLDRMTRHFLSPRYRAETIADWCGRAMGIEVDADDVRSMDLEQLKEYVVNQAERQADVSIQEQMAENIPEEVEAERERNWQAMSKWANVHFGLNTNDRELKKIGVADLQLYLFDRAKEAIARIDLSPLDGILSDDWSCRSLSGWVRGQYNLQLAPEKFTGLDQAAAAKLIREEIADEYQDKEIEFPVNVGLTNFLTDQNGHSRNDRGGLVRWANGRFQARLDLTDMESRSRQDVATELTRLSEAFLARGKGVSRVDEWLDRTYGTGAGTSSAKAPATAALQELITWANTEFEAGMSVTDLDGANRQVARVKLLQSYELRYRPELYQAERLLLLDMLDSSWKDHLYFMDHLRSGIGLVGYAQKDPKVEYRREGMRAFEQMWDRISEQVTQAIFRLENFNPEFVGSLWKITSASHEAPAAVDNDDASAGGPPSAAAGGPSVVETIRNQVPRVGRNEPCPCGSGKKYKKCCGANE